MVDHEVFVDLVMAGVDNFALVILTDSDGFVILLEMWPGSFDKLLLPVLNEYDIVQSNCW